MSVPLPREIEPEQPWAEQIKTLVSNVVKQEIEEEKKPSTHSNKVKTYHWTPEQIEEYLSKKYPGLKVPEGKKKPSAPGAWQTKNKPTEVPKE